MGKSNNNNNNKDLKATVVVIWFQISKIEFKFKLNLIELV